MSSATTPTTAASLAPFTFTPPLPGQVLLTGVLHKLGARNRAWKPRLCVLTNHGEVHYFLPEDSITTRQVNTTKQQKGTVNCRESVIRPRLQEADNVPCPSGDGLAFTIQPAADSRRYEFYAETMADRDEWIEKCSQFGDGPLSKPGTTQISAKAKELLFGGKTATSASPDPTASSSSPTLESTSPTNAHKELKLLGLSEAAFDKFKGSTKAFQKLGAFDNSSLKPEEAALPTPATPIADIISARSLQPSPLPAPHLTPSLGILPNGESVFTCGWLTKLGGKAGELNQILGTNWQRRFFILTQQGLVHYWERPEQISQPGSTIRGTIDANNSLIRYMDPQEFNPPQSHVFSFLPVKAGSKKYILAADSLVDRDHWVQALSHFGDGPVSLSEIQRSKNPSVSSKAKDVLFGTSGGGGGRQASASVSVAPSSSASSETERRPTMDRSMTSDKVLDKLGISERALDKFSSNPKAFAKLGLFDDENANKARGRNASVAGINDELPHIERYNLQGQLIVPVNILRTGTLAKEGGSFKSVHVRFFVLTPDSVFYYGSAKDATPKGQIDLSQGGVVQAAASTTTNTTAYSAAFTVTPVAKEPGTNESRQYVLYAPDAGTRDEWIQAVQEVIHMVNNKQRKNSTTGGSTTSATSPTAAANKK